MPAEDTLGALSACLEEERQILLSGRIDGLAAIAARKAELAARLPHPQPADRPRIDRLRTQAESNASLLAAAAAGLRAVTEAMALARAGGPGLSTYDAAGRSVAQPGASSVLRRA